MLSRDEEILDGSKWARVGLGPKCFLWLTRLYLKVLLAFNNPPRPRLPLYTKGPAMLMIPEQIRAFAEVHGPDLRRFQTAAANSWT